MDIKKQINHHNKNMNHFENTYYFNQRALLDAMNLSVGILVTGIMIYKMKNSNI